jgi:hypothetical protein
LAKGFDRTAGNADGLRAGVPGGYILMNKFQRTTIVMLLFILQFHTYNKKELVTHHPVVTIGENKKKIEATSTQPWVVANT